MGGRHGHLLEMSPTQVGQWRRGKPPLRASHATPGGKPLQLATGGGSVVVVVVVWGGGGGVKGR